MSITTTHDVGVVVIGRNEGARLRRCLRSVQHLSPRVYVDSGSTDGSPSLARELGFEVVDLPCPPGYTAARARNAGLRRLVEIRPALPLVQMIDGDCELAPGWVATARAALLEEPLFAAVFGRRRELHPNASPYNMMCDDEWNVPIGEARSCGGDALFRVSAVLEVGGYADALIAGEEPDLCSRLRRGSWRICRIPDEMTVHDAAILKFSQWWRRTKRGGHAFAELTHRHGRWADRNWIWQLISMTAWCGLAAAGLVALVGYLVSGRIALLTISLSAVLMFLLQGVRLTLRRFSRGMALPDAARWSGLILVGKFAQAQGAIQFVGNQLRSLKPELIEYKK